MSPKLSSAANQQTTRRIVLGIDPGSRITGYGVIEAYGRKTAHIDNGIARPNPRLAHAARLNYIFDKLCQIIAQYSPTEIAIEEVFVSRNVLSALLLGQSRGIALLAAARANLPIYEYSTRLVKQSVVGYGNADKNQIQFMTSKLLKLPEPAAEDAADALAVALTHVQCSGRVSVKQS